MCGPPLNHSSHKTDTVFQQTNLKCTMYVDTEIIPELLQVLTVTWLQYLAKYLLNNWGLLLPCGAKFTLWCLWEEFPVGRELRRTWECCQWAAETTACLHFLPNPIETYVYTQITPWPLNQFFCACILSILETHAHKGRHFHHFTINIVTYRSTRVATHKPKKRKGKKKKRLAFILHLPRTFPAHRSHSGGSSPEGSENAASAVTLRLAPFQAQLYGGWEILRISRCTLEKESSGCTHMAEMTDYWYDSKMQSNLHTHTCEYPTKSRIQK